MLALLSLLLDCLLSLRLKVGLKFSAILHGRIDLDDAPSAIIQLRLQAVAQSFFHLLCLLVLLHLVIEDDMAIAFVPEPFI